MQIASNVPRGRIAPNYVEETEDIVPPVRRGQTGTSFPERPRSMVGRGLGYGLGDFRRGRNPDCVGLRPWPDSRRAGVRLGTSRSGTPIHSIQAGRRGHGSDREPTAADHPRSSPMVCVVRSRLNRIDGEPAVRRPRAPRPARRQRRDDGTDIDHASGPDVGRGDTPRQPSTAGAWPSPFMQVFRHGKWVSLLHARMRLESQDLDRGWGRAGAGVSVGRGRGSLFREDRIAIGLFASG